MCYELRWPPDADRGTLASAPLVVADVVVVADAAERSDSFDADADSPRATAGEARRAPVNSDCALVVARSAAAPVPRCSISFEMTRGIVARNGGKCTASCSAATILHQQRK